MFEMTVNTLTLNALTSVDSAMYLRRTWLESLISSSERGLGEHKWMISLILLSLVGLVALTREDVQQPLWQP